MGEDSLLKVSGLKKWFSCRKGFVDSLFSKDQYVKAVDDVNFVVKKAEIFGLIGESGCGKTTLGRLILRLVKPTAGKVLFENRDMFSIKGRKEMLDFRRKAQMIFQDPYESLSPRSTIFDIISEPLKIHNDVSYKANVRDKVLELLEITGLPPTEEFMSHRPTQLSGGQRQRVLIASRLILRPEFIVADEPVSMLDASLRSSILNLLLDLRKTFKITYLFISHDISLAWYVCDRVAVMYFGKIVETGPTEKIIREPAHPYAKALMGAVPTLDPSAKPHLHIDKLIHGQIASHLDPPSGCKFHPRCPHVTDKCSREEPRSIKLNKDHSVACHLLS